MREGKGWFIIPGVQNGDRTIEEQMVAVKPALDECSGKTVLDLGCAEGLMSYEFIKAGALRVVGLEYCAEHVTIGQELFKEPNLNIRHHDLNRLPGIVMFDIVLALGVVHKLYDPGAGLTYAARCARNLLLLRSGRGQRKDGRIYGKQYPYKSCDPKAILTKHGFALEKIVDGLPQWDEPTQYWRRAC